MKQFRKNKYFLGYLGTWGCLLILGSLVAEDMEPRSLVLTTALLALVVPLLILVCDRVGADAPKGKCYTVHRMGDGQVVCRVEGMFLYRGTEDKPTWYIQGKKVYAFSEKGYLYRMKDGKLYRRNEDAPCMEIRLDTIYSLPDGEPLYQTVE